MKKVRRSGGKPENSSHLTNANNYLRVSAGFETDIRLNREFNYILDKPYSNCDIMNSGNAYNSYLYNLIAYSPYDYTQHLCFQQCAQNTVIQACNCTKAVDLSLFYTAEQCESISEIKCLENVTNHAINKNGFISQYCLEYCPLECNYTLINGEISVIQSLDNWHWVDMIKENTKLKSDFVYSGIDLKSAKESIVKLNIYYETLSYKLSNESPQMDIVSLMADIGGTLGLFMGVSVFSLCEIVVVLIEIYFIK